ncbi:hypothetical protein AUQ48_00370 [Kocuria flava]|uniref:YdbS-like PH domain-containing protein n=1 Tax=Kocuria flava TaxID=446860 RepID=A0A2N4SYD2_9MICC|nr:PH domain-containing protein [Kocuria flava]PLC10990.1 hypothetical protein AUQ48_00370 [Kocuria flava]
MSGAPAPAARPVAGHPGEEAAWRRVHPLTPVVRGWLAVLVLGGAFVNIVLDDLVGGYLGAPGPRPPEDLDLSRLGTGFWLAAAGGAALLLGAAAGVVLVSWWFTRFQVGAEHVRVRSGVLFRRERQARLDRVQAIDIHRPFVPRLLGLAELKFEVADAGESAVSLAYLTHAQARALRAELLGRLPRPAAPGGRRPAPGRTRPPPRPGRRTSTRCSPSPRVG